MDEGVPVPGATRGPQPPCFAGVDVGGTNIKLGVVDSAGSTLTSTSLPTQQERGPADAIARTASRMAELEAELPVTARPVAVGLGTPGTMDPVAGVILEPPNLPNWRHFAIREELQRAVQRPVAYANDANAAAFGEYWLGCGRDVDSLVLFTLGTGIGGGIVVADRLLVGATGNGAECGHTVVDTSLQARVCSCGVPGHLEAYASATAIAREAERRAAERAGSALALRLQSQGHLTAHDVYLEAEAGDALAQELIQEAGRFLGRGIVTMANVVDPELVVLGGAMDFGGDASPVGREFRMQLQEAVARGALPEIAENVRVVFATLGSAAGWIGAAGLARQQYLQESAGHDNR